MKHPIYTEFNLDAKVGVSNLIAVTHTDDRNADVLEVSVRQNGVHIDLTGATAIARMVLHKDKDYLLSDSVPCAVSDGGNILIPFDSAVVPVQKGVIKIEVNLTQADSVLTLQFPLWVSVNGSILDSAEVTPESKGTVPELLKEAADALDDATAALEQLGSYDNLDDKPQINGVTLSGNQTSEALDLQNKLTAGDNVSIDANGKISAKDTNNYNELSNKPKIRFTGQSVTLNGVLEFYFGDFTGEVLPGGVSISLRENVFKSTLSPTDNIPYNFNAIKSNLLYTGVFKIRKVDVTNLPQEFTEAGATIYVYHYVSTKTYSDLIRMVTYETADGVKMWSQLVALGGMDASDNVQVTAQTAWVELTGTPKEDISGAVVTLNQSVYTYDGTSKAPSVTSVVLNGQTLTAGTDYAVIANPATNAGQYVVVVNGMGDYKGTVTTAWEIAKAQAIINGDDSITIPGIDDPVTKTYTTDGDGAFSFAITGNIASVANIGGEVTITPTALGSTTMTVTLLESANYLGATKTVPVEIVNPVTVFGVVWDYSLSSPQLARLTPQTDPLGVVTTVPLQEPTACIDNDGNGQSDFDNYMPWAGMQRFNYANGQVVDFIDYNNGETFVYIPEYWSKIVNNTANSKMYIYISDLELNGFTKHPGSGRYMSRYKCNDNFLSAPGSMPKVRTSLATFRTGITAIDNYHFQYDIHTYSAIKLLYIVEWAHFNSQNMIGAGIVRSSAQTLGQTDTLTYHTGRVSGPNDTNAVQYRWIENPWGCVNDWIDGILIQDGKIYICNDETLYADSITNSYYDTGIVTPTSGSGWLKTGSDYNNQYIFPKTVNGSDSTYLCDNSYYNAGLRGLLVGGYYNSGFSAGLFYWDGSTGPDEIYMNVGGRSILIIGGDA